MNKVVILCLVLCLLGLGLVSETEGKSLSFYMLEYRQHVLIQKVSSGWMVGVQLSTVNS